MNSPLATPDEVGQAISNDESLFRSAGIGRSDLEMIAGQMKAVAPNR